MHAELRASQLADIDLLTPNETEFAQLLARFSGVAHEASSFRSMSDEALSQLAVLLPVAGVLITLGDAGAVLFPGARAAEAAFPISARRQPAATVQTLDTTGAGDAFNGALAAAWALMPQADPAECLVFASAFAGLSTERRGAAAAMPTKAELSARFKR
jgi:ribokinase